MKMFEVVNNFVGLAGKYDHASGLKAELAILAGKLELMKDDVCIAGVLTEKINALSALIAEKVTPAEVKGKLLADFLAALPADFLGNNTRITLVKDSTGRGWLLHSTSGTAAPVVKGLSADAVCQHFAVVVGKDSPARKLMAYAKILGTTPEALTAKAMAAKEELEIRAKAEALSAKIVQIPLQMAA